MPAFCVMQVLSLDFNYLRNLLPKHLMVKIVFNVSVDLVCIGTPLGRPLSATSKHSVEEPQTHEKLKKCSLQLTANLVRSSTRMFDQIGSINCLPDVVSWELRSRCQPAHWSICTRRRRGGENVLSCASQVSARMHLCVQSCFRVVKRNKAKQRVSED